MKTVSYNALRGAALALPLIAGLIFLPQAASAGSLDDRGDFGGTWNDIGPTGHERWRYVEGYYGPPVDVVPGYAYGPVLDEPEFYAPPAYDEYGPGVVLVAPDVGPSLEID